MKILFLALWLQMSAQPQIQGSCAKCLVGTMTQQADETDGKPGAHIYSVEELEAQGWKKSEISVCKYQVFADKRVELDGPDCPASVVREAMHPADPVDVPAVQVTVPAPHPCNLAGPSMSDCITGPEIHTTCADKSRVLLTSEDGKKHCIKF